MDQSDERPPPPPFPPRMFAVGHEPVGIRVTPYHKPTCIRKILNALDPDEVEFIRGTLFGTLIEIADKPSSGRFGRFLLSRQLKVAKKHEVWFLFAGKPVRFSHREFALVTGLNCLNYPPHTKKKSKKNISEKPYWGELFGYMKEVPASYVISMLKKKTVTDRGIRIKYALLAFLSAVVLPTSHNPRIAHEFAEKIKDVDHFLAYPWGRASFEMLISSIKERDEVSLSQKTIALKGFVLSIQLVMIEAAPSLTRVVQDACSSGSEGDGQDDNDFVDGDNEGMKSINPAHVRETDLSGKAHVVSIVSDGVVLNNVEAEILGSDGEDDALVDNLVKCIQDGYPFCHSHFSGGSSAADVIRMREDAKKENNVRKTSKGNISQHRADGLDADYVASIVKQSVTPDLRWMEEEIKNLGQFVKKSQNQLQSYLHGMFDTLMRDMSNVKPPQCTRTHADTPDVTEKETTDSRKNATTGSNPADTCYIIQEALLFADQVTVPTTNAPFVDVSYGEEANPIFEENDTGRGDDPENVFNTPAQKDPAPLPTDDFQPFTKPLVDENTSAPEMLTDCYTILKEKNVHTNLAFPKPTFSLGLSQEEAHVSKTDSSAVVNVDESVEDVVQDPLPVNQDQFPAHRKSKRQKVVPRALVGDFQCDKRFLTRAWEAHVNATHGCLNIDYAGKFGVLSEKLQAEFVIKVGGHTLVSSELSAFISRSSHLPAKVVDVLIHQTRMLLQSQSEPPQHTSAVFLDTKFVSLLSKTFAKFSKSSKKESFRFPTSLIELVRGGCPPSEDTRIYLPFNFDKKHWIGVCVDSAHSQVIALDCNTSLRTDAMINKELRPISEMFPYIVRHAAEEACSKDLKPLSIERPRVVPQNNIHFDSESPLFY